MMTPDAAPSVPQGPRPPIGPQPKGELESTDRARSSGTDAANASEATGPNDYRRTVDGPAPNFAVGGNQEQQEYQRDQTIKLGALAAASYATGNLPGGRVPSDAQVQETLANLDRNPPIGEDGEEVTHVVYTSEIDNASPEEVYQHFVEDPNEVFNAGGMEIRPAGDRLEDGGRYMLELGGPVPSWLPVEIELHPQRNALTIHTLDGHVLRGEQTFYFEPNGDGGTVIRQDAHFQASSELAGESQEVLGIAQGQHDAWEHAHREAYEEFNGNPDYEGLGTEPLTDQQAHAWLGTLQRIADDPAAAADAIIDTVGVMRNAVIDEAGDAAAGVLDWAGASGAAYAVDRGADRAGDFAEHVADAGGDLVEDTADTIGRWFR